MVTTTFPPLAKQISWTDSLTDANGNALPAGESVQSTTIGIRPDGNAAYSLGNYQYKIIVIAPATTESFAAVNAAVGGALPPGNYWANAMETAVLNGNTASSVWGTTEIPFSIPFQVVAPAAPTALSVG